MYGSRYCRRLCGNMNSFRTRDRVNQKQRVLKVRKRRVEFGCQPFTSAAVNMAEVVEGESVV